MPDVLDEIIDKLPQSTIQMILDLGNGHSQICANVDNLLQQTQQIKVKQINNEFGRKLFCTMSKTKEMKKKLVKLKNELEILKNLEKPGSHLQSMQAYTGKINELELQIKNLVRDHGDIDLSLLFNNIENLHEEIKEYQKKIEEVKLRNKLYDGFPPNLEQGKQEIAKIKEKIKNNQVSWESKEK